MGESSPLRIGLVAGESSGDQLGAALITAIRARVPDARFYGVCGPKMQALGCEVWASADELAVMGLTEVLHHLPRLLRLRRNLVERFQAERPHAFVGIDAPEFNLGLAARLKAAGLHTVQYVSPQVWAWRQGRVKTIGNACDLVLCLLPFETEFYERWGVRAVFVGHPLADQIPLEVDRAGARAALGLDPSGTFIALLPGSRMGEVEKLGPDFIAAVQWLRARRPDLQFMAPMASAKVRHAFERHLQAAGETHIRLIDSQAQRVLAAANVVLTASGTATLETLLSQRPMVVAYRLGSLTAFMLRRFGLVKVPYFSQPNLLVGRRLVPEFFQEQVTGEALGAALLGELENPARLLELEREFRQVHEQLRVGGAGKAADAILELINVRGGIRPEGSRGASR
jgi:lipid-A-disaccharide synthase